MSRLGDLENAIVNRLSQAMIGGSPAFETVRGFSGGNRAALREALRRERMPAAYVGFTDEPTAPEVRDQVRGAKFVVLVAARVLRLESDPRNGDANSIGAFQLLEASRTQLDDYAPSTGLQLVSVQEKFIDADNRVAIYELLYRVWPIVLPIAALLFDGSTIAGSDSVMTLDVGPFELEQSQFSFVGGGGVFQQALNVRPRTLVWRGEMRAQDNTSLNTIEAGIESRIVGQVPGNVTDGGSRVFTDCVLDRYVPDEGRRSEVGMIVQDAELHFLQLNPLS